MARKPNTEIRNKVLDLRTKGLTMAAIASELGISVQMAAYYSKQILEVKK